MVVWWSVGFKKDLLQKIRRGHEPRKKTRTELSALRFHLVRARKQKAKNGRTWYRCYNVDKLGDVWWRCRFMQQSMICSVAKFGEEDSQEVSGTRMIDMTNSCEQHHVRIAFGLLGENSPSTGFWTRVLNTLFCFLNPCRS